jgi:flagellum-specific ATP synthase
MDEPVADTVRGILDGQIVLSRTLAQSYHYPAIDVLQSISRLAHSVSGPSSKAAAGEIRRTMAVYARAEDLINVGAYHQGSNPEIDYAIAKHGQIENFLIQDIDEPSTLEETLQLMSEITGVDIPQEEMADTNEKLIAAAGGALRRVKLQKTEAARLPVEDSAMALNTIESLFSSLPAASVL